MKRLLIVLLMALITVVAFADEQTTETTTFEEPILITSGGQSPGALQMMVLAKTGGFDFEFIKDVEPAKENIAAFNTIIVVVGASGKGLGAAGIDVDDEIARLEELVSLAKAEGKSVIIAQIEGATRRGPSSDKISDAIAHEAELLLIKKDADEDGKFTTIANENEIEIIHFEKTSDARGVLKDVFNK